VCQQSRADNPRVIFEALDSAAVGVGAGRRGAAGDAARRRGAGERPTGGGRKRCALAGLRAC